MALAVQILEEARNGLFIFADERAFRAPLFAISEHVQRRASHALQLREYAHHREHPRTVLALARLARDGIGLRPERRREVHVDLEAALELLPDALEEPGIRVQASDLVLVLVSHELEEVTGDGLRELRRAGDARLLGLLHALDEVRVVLRVFLVL